MRALSIAIARLRIKVRDITAEVGHRSVTVADTLGFASVCARDVAYDLRDEVVHAS